MGKKGGAVRMKQMGPKAPPMNPMKDLMDQANNEPTIIVPPKLDPEITNFVPESDSFTMKSKFMFYPCIWPSYIDSNKSPREGRRIKKEQSVDTPSVLDISEVLESLAVRHAIQPNKGYPRDVESRWDNPGCVRFDFEQIRDGHSLVDVSNELLSDEAVDITQKQIWRFIASKIPNMPGRKQRLEDAKLKKAAEEKKAREDAKLRAILNSKKSVASVGGSTKKKGKKRK